jgi:thioredoxin reductase (NADPH)
MEIYDIVIIGGGAAGLSAAVYACRGGKKTLVLEKLSCGGQAAKTHEIDNYPGFDDLPTGEELGARLENHARKFGAQIIRENVKSIADADADIKIIKTRKNEYGARAVIFATGAKPRLLGVEGEDEFTGAGVSYCASCDGAFFRGQTALVVGGGNTAFEDALYLSSFCPKVYLVHRSDRFRAVQTLVDKAKSDPRIEFVTDSTVEKIQGDTAVTSVILKHTLSDRVKRLDTSAVFVAVGINPDSELAKTVVDTNKSGFIVTDREMACSVRGFFAAGDVRDTPLRQVITAAADGAVAATSAISYINSRLA